MCSRCLKCKLGKVSEGHVKFMCAACYQLRYEQVINQNFNVNRVICFREFEHFPTHYYERDCSCNATLGYCCRWSWFIVYTKIYPSRSLTYARPHRHRRLLIWDQHTETKALRQPWHFMDLKDRLSSDGSGFMMQDEQPEGQANSSLCWQPLVIERFTVGILQLIAHKAWEK